MSEGCPVSELLKRVEVLHLVSLCNSVFGSSGIASLPDDARLPYHQVLDVDGGAAYRSTK